MFSQTQQSYSMLFIDLRRHVSIPLESSSGPLWKNTDPLHRTIKTRYGIPNVHNKLIFKIRTLKIWFYVMDLYFFREGLMMIPRSPKVN